MNKYSLKNLVIDFTLFLSILSLVAITSIHIVKAETLLANRLSGKILLQVEDNGEAWYLNPQDNKRSYLGRPHDAFNIMREEGVGITNDNLEKIPLSLDNLSGEDSDSDGLPDNFEIAIGTDPNNSDTDNDGYDDYTEVLNNYSPRGDNAKRQTIDKSFAKFHQGKIFIQVEGNGEAWYVDTTENKRHYLGRPSDAFSIMRHLGLGISNTNLNQITIREGKGIQEYNYSEPKQEQQQGEENKEEYKNHITVTTHKPELMREFSNIINVSATINDSSGYDFKEKGFLFDYTMNKDEALTPTLANHKEKLIDNTPGLSIEAEIDNLLPKSYPYIRAYVITAEDIVYYGNTEVLIMGNTETVDSIGAPGTPPMFGGGGGGGSVSRPDPEPVYYDLTYTAGDNGYLATTAPEVVVEPEIPEWESETELPTELLTGSSQVIGDYLYIFDPIIDDGMVYDSVNDFNLSEITSTNVVYRYNLISQEWDYASSSRWHQSEFYPETHIVGDKVYLLSRTEACNSIDVQVYDPTINLWEDATELNADNCFEFLTGGVYNDKIYVIGEAEDMYGYLEINIYDPATDSWELGDTIPYNDYYGDIRSVIINDTFYIFDSNLPFEDIVSYNIVTEELIVPEDRGSVASVPGGEIMGNIINYNGNILYLGGMVPNFETPGLTYSDKVYLYIENTNSWTEIFTLPQANVVMGAIAISDDNRLYLVGGVNNFIDLFMSEDYPTAISSSYSLDLSLLTGEYINSISAANWQTKSSLPVSLAETGSLIINDTIYLTGGYSNELEDFSDIIYSYNTNDDEWVIDTTIPADAENPDLGSMGRVNPLTVNIGDDIYIIGGISDSGPASSSLKYNINTKEFTTLPNLDFDAYNPVGGVYNDKIYVFNTSMGSPIGPPIEAFDTEEDFELQDTTVNYQIFDPNTNTWEVSDYIVGPSDNSEIIFIDGILYFIGGINIDSLVTISNEMGSYNINTETWNTLSSMPEPRVDGSVVYNNNKIYYFGGVNNDEENVDTIFEYDIATNSWDEYPYSMPELTKESAIKFFNDDIYIIGGVIGEFIERTTTSTVHYLGISENIEEGLTIIEQRVLEGNNGSEVYAVANDGYQFSSWSDGNTSNPRTDNNVQSDINVTANFTETPYYTLTYQADEGSHLIIGEETDWNNTYLPVEIYNPITGLIGDKIYIFYQDLLLSYDPENDTYINHSDQLNGDLSPYTFWNSGATELVYDNKLYYFGVGPNFSSSAMFNPETMTITRLADMPISRQGYAEYYNGEIYFFSNQNYDKFYIYNVEENTWREGGYSPLNYVNNIVKVDDKFYFATGNDTWFDRYYCYDPENNNWKELNNIEGLEIRGAGVNYTGDKILYIGALDFLSSEVETDNVFIYDISEDSWYISDYYHNFPYDLDDLILFEDNIYTPYDESIFSTSIYNFPFDEYSVEVREGDDGPNIYANTNILDSGTFLGWSDGETSNPRKDRNVQEDISVSSSFDIPEYTLTYSVGDNRYAYGGGNLVIASEQNDWVQNKDLPIEGAWQSDGGLYNIMSASVGSKIYIFGGYLNREQYKTITLIYNTETDTYEEIDNENYDPEDVFDYRENSFDISIGDKIYSIGGRNVYYDIVASSTVFDTSTNTWSDISDPANEIYMGAIEVYNGEIYLFNGGYNTLEIYNPDTDTWRLSDTTPIPGIYDSELVDGVFFLQGREITNPETHEFTGQLSAYYPDTDTWEIRANDYATHIYSESYTNLLKYNSFQNDQGIIVYIEDGRYEIPWSGFIGSAVYDTTSYRSLNPDGNPIADDHYNWSQIPLLTDLTGYDYHVIDDYLYLIGGTLEGITKPINQKIPMINFPVNHYSETVKKGQNGPIVVPNNHPGADLFKWSDDDPATYGTPRQDTNIQEDINVEAYFGAYT